MSNTALDLFAESPRDAAINTLHYATALYTQDPVVTKLLDLISWKCSGAVIDTSCGDGAFLVRALERLLSTSFNIADDNLCELLQGWEIHPYAAKEARLRLQQVLINHGRSYGLAQSMAERMIHTGDFLTEGPPEGKKYRAIIGNPPYLRMSNVPDPLRSEYEAVLPLYAQADLLHSFLDRCVALLEPDGELAMVTADRWLFNEGAARLREVVGSHFSVAHIERLESSSTFYRPKQRRAGTPPRVHPVGIVLKAHAPGLRKIDREPFYPEDPVLEDMPSRVLGQIADVRIAPWLGTPGIFVVHESLASNWPEGSTVPAIDTDDIEDGILGTPYRRAILTLPDVQPAPQIMAHLDAQLPRMCERGRSAIRWMPPETFHNRDLTQPSLIVPRIATGLKAIRVPAGVLAINHNISVVQSTEEFSLAEIEKVLNNPMSQKWIANRAPRLENGYLSITTKFLRTLPAFGCK